MSDDTRPIGKGMLYVSWLLVLGFLTWGFGQWQEKKLNPNASPSTFSDRGVNEVVLKRNKYGHYLTSGEINGKKVVFMLDTGATHIAIPEKMANRLKLKKMAHSTVSTANGYADVFLTRINEVRIGNIVFHDVGASINPGMNHDDTILLGMSVMKEIEFTQQGDELVLRQYTSGTH